MAADPGGLLHLLPFCATHLGLVSFDACPVLVTFLNVSPRLFTLLNP